MKPNDTRSTRRLRALFWTALSSWLAVSASAESVVFNADFPSGANTVSQTPSVISPSGATWYGAYNKANGAISTDPFSLVLSSTTGSSSAVINGAGRITQAPITLASVNDFIELSGTFYTDGLTNIAFGLFNSGGVDPLATLLNNGLATSGTAPGGGTFGWTGYRAMTLNNSATANFVARPAQTGTAYASYELLSVGTGAYNSPASVAVGTVSNSASVVLWNNEDAFNPYDFTFRITRNTATTFAFSFIIKNSGTSTVVYSTSGSTSAAGALPSAITSSFDAVAFGGRVNAAPYLQLTALKVIASNADIAKITVQPAAQNLPLAGSGSIGVTATGSGTLTYQWYKDGSAISGATSATYNFTNVSSADAGQYHVVVKNAHGYETSQTVTVNVSSLAAPAITTQPITQSVDAGSTLTLTAEASGVPTPTYQWYLNNSPISGATLATYSVANVTTDAAGTYKVVATNSQGSATSNNAVVTVNTAAPAITAQPAPVTVNVGQAINLTATASGLPPPSYQWYLNGEPIAGATSPTYSVASAATLNAGTYTVTATNPYGSTTSDGALVTVNVVLPSLTTQPPAALTVHQGQAITINAAYAGSLPRTYQWYRDSEAISGATGATYTIAAASSADAGTYHVVVTNEGGSASSNNTVVAVVGTAETSVFATNFAADTKNNPATPITSGSTSWFILAGRDATNSSVGDNPATVDVVEARPLTLTWNTTASSAIVETAARFSTSPVALAGVGDYLRVRATLSGTNLRTLCFGLYNSYGVSPLPLDASDAGNTMGSTNAVGTGTQNWTGYRSSLTIGNSGGDIGTRPAQTATTTNRGQELLFPAGSTGAAFGEPAGVSVGIIPGVGGTIALTNNTTYTLNYSITLSATNQYTISYALYSGSSATGTPLYATNAVTSAAGALPSDVATGFDALAIGIRNVDSTSVPTLVITDLSVVKGVASANVAPAITTQPSGQTLNAGDTLTLTAAASGNPAPTYQWYKNDSPISGATAATYTKASVTTDDTGSYKVVATNSAGSATSNAVTVTVNAAASAYQTWASGQGLSAGVNDGATQDPDNDGVNNLLEFALGGNPLAASSAILPVAARDGANLTLTFDIKVAAKAEYTIGAESSTDLGAWAAVVHGAAGATVTETALDGSTNRVVVTVPASGARTFLRVKVAAKP